MRNQFKEACNKSGNFVRPEGDSFETDKGCRVPRGGSLLRPMIDLEKREKIANSLAAAVGAKSLAEGTLDLKKTVKMQTI